MDKEYLPRLWENRRERHIPFRPHFRDAMLEGRKTCTSRTRRIGQQGDIFVAFGKLFEIVHVDQMTVGEIAARLYCEEGFDSREAFLEELARIYPRTGRNPDAHMWVHKFVRMDATT